MYEGTLRCIVRNRGKSTYELHEQQLQDQGVFQGELNSALLFQVVKMNSKQR
jgi:hypothetical protein